MRLYNQSCPPCAFDKLDLPWKMTFSRPGHYAIIISMAGIPGSDLPLGHTPEGGACSRLVILFHWSQVSKKDEMWIFMHRTEPQNIISPPQASENPTKWRQDKVKAEKWVKTLPLNAQISSDLHKLAWLALTGVIFQKYSVGSYFWL